MNCIRCGAELQEGMQVCSFCGTIQGGSLYYVQNNHGKKKKRIILISAILTVLITAAIITTVCILNSDSHKQKSIEGTVELFFESIEDGDYNKYMSLVPKYWQRHLKGSLDSITRNALKDYISDFNCKNGNELYFKITDCSYMKDSKLSTLKYNFKNWYDVTGEIEAYVFLDIIVADKYGHEWTFTDFDLIKIDGKWYIGFGNI